LYKLVNTIRRASRESQNLKARDSFRIRDEEGHNVEGILTDTFTYYLRDMFRDAGEEIRLRLARTMVLRRRRILYRRSRYGTDAIRPQEIPDQPHLEPFRSQTMEKEQQHLGQPISKALPLPTHDKSIAQSATTVAADKFQTALAPSVVSTSKKTVALSEFTKLSFPSAPLGRVKAKFEPLRLQLLEEFNVKTTDRFWDPQSHIQVPSEPTTQPFHTVLINRLNEAWRDCLQAVAEITCPYCFYVLPAEDVANEKKWQ